VRGSCDDRTAGMFGEATMIESWEGMGKAAHIGGETSVGTLQAR
jgi:hypothetical protein